MQLDTPEGKLTIDDAVLTFEPSDDGPVLTVGLDPMPDYRYERGVYGKGTLVIADNVIVLDNEQATPVAEELERPRAGKTRKSADTVKSDSDEAASK